MPDQIALFLINQLQKKLSNPSYRRVYDVRGKGILLLTCESIAFDVVNLTRVVEELVAFQSMNDLGFFATAYFEYDLERERYYRLIYGHVEIRDQLLED